jgi:hypothetical protein
MRPGLPNLNVHDSNIQSGTKTSVNLLSELLANRTTNCWDLDE